MKQSRRARKAHIDKANALSVKNQCEVLQISRSSHYYRKVPQSSLNLQLMRLIDEAFLNHPWKGVPRMTNWLQQDIVRSPFSVHFKSRIFSRFFIAVVVGCGKAGRKSVGFCLGFLSIFPHHRG